MFMFNQGQLKVKVKTLYDCQGQNLTLFFLLHIAYSSLSVKALDYDFTFL